MQIVNVKACLRAIDNSGEVSRGGRSSVGVDVLIGGG